MDMESTNGRETKTAQLEDLLKATKENIEKTTEQNIKMVKYTKWIFIFTIIVILFFLLTVLALHYRFNVLAIRK